MKVFLWQKSDHFLVLISVFLSGFIEPFYFIEHIVVLHQWYIADCNIKV